MKNINILARFPEKAINTFEAEEDVIEIKDEPADIEPNPVQTIDNHDEQNAVFYSIRISQTELMKFLSQQRIYPCNGEFYLRDSL